MDDNKFWLGVLRIILIGFLVLVISIMGSCQLTKYQIRVAIEKGATPMAAQCAIDGSVGANDICALISAAEAERTRTKAEPSK